MTLPIQSKVASPDEVENILLPMMDEQSDDRDIIKEVNVKEIRELDIDAEMHKVQLKRLIEDNLARKTFSHWIFAVTVLWMFCVLMIVVQVGRHSILLSDGVLIALITTTTANVFGFFYVVVNYLFNRNKST